MITRRQIGLATESEIREAIEQCDVQALPGEKAELLLPYIPTKEEVNCNSYVVACLIFCVKLFLRTFVTLVLLT